MRYHCRADAHPGAMFHPYMATEARFTVAFDDGARLGSGRRWRNTGRVHSKHWPIQHRQYHSSRPCLGSGRERGNHRRTLGRSRGGFTSKLDYLADSLERPIAFPLTGGEAADCKAHDALIGLPEGAPVALLADKGTMSPPTVPTLPIERSRLSCPVG